MNGYFTKDDGTELPVDDEFLFSALSPTTPGTHYRSPPPPGEVTERQQGRMLLQIHQTLHLFKEFQIDLEGKNLLDIGTGNGLVPRMLLELSGLKSAVGSDPYLDGEHTTSWQPHDHDETMRGLLAFLEKYCPNGIDFDTYKQLLGHENFSMTPQALPYQRSGEKQYRFSQIGAHDLKDLGEIFDIVYCKAIEHIPDWPGVFRAIADTTQEGAIVYFKHRSFFSYLGPHRYASTAIPWGHLLLTDEEYKRYAAEFHPEDAEMMVDFYFNGLSYPRTTVSEMVRAVRDHDLLPVAVVVEPPRYLSAVYRFIDQVDGFWDMVKENHPSLAIDEMLSGMHHIILRKAA